MSSKKYVPFQFMSDLHIECDWNYTPTVVPIAPIMILVGDIGHPSSDNYREFIKLLSNKFESVIVIAGNHEFHDSGKTIHEITEMMNEFFATLPNVYFLNNQTIILNSMVFIGSTLWSKIGSHDIDDLRENAGDFRKITVKNKGDCEKLSINYVNEMHTVAVEFIRSEIEQYKDKGLPIVVLTHHVPIFDLLRIPEKYRKNKYNDLFYSDLSELVVKADVWLFGHTHTYMRFHVGDCLLMNNPRGHPFENSKWNPNMYYRIA